MSYAIETKKRKFDRILESLTDHSTPSRTSLNTRNNDSNISIQDESESAKKRRLAASSSGLGSLRNPSTTSLLTQYLPSDRRAFLDRLETFRKVTKWHVPSTESINAAAWCKRGWICVDTDLVSCGSCHERLLVQLDADEPIQSYNGAQDDVGEDVDEYSSKVHTELVKKYEALIVDSHRSSCPWRRRGCDASVQRIEGLLNVSAALDLLKRRYGSMMAAKENIPHVQSLAEYDDTYEEELRHLAIDHEHDLNTDTLILAVCGWQQKDTEVVECLHCFRSLGLWLYRGEAPTMDRLDPIDSHLDYCPWRSPEAQDTEVALSSKDTATEKSRRKVAGWQLVCEAITKDNAKRGRKRKTSGEALPRATSPEALTPEQKDKKMRDLLKRIKDIKKPFNVKALLKKKEKPKS